MFDLTGKTALITGGNSGIGLGMAEGLAKCGCDIAIWGRSADKNAQAVETLSTHGTKVSAYICDVTSSEAVNDAFAATLNDHGRVDGCFANAGFSTPSSGFDQSEDAHWQQMIDINLNGAYYVLRVAAAHMRERAEGGDRFGRLVGTSSIGALNGMPRNQHYAAAKGALISMIRSLAVEYARYGVTAHSILPGFVETPLTDESFASQAFADKVLPRIPARRLGQGSDFSAIAAYIMSDASAWHTGQDFIIDGGYMVF